MVYNNIKKGIFLSRPNRFIAHIEIDGISQVCHVKNTGRCKELLTDRARVFVNESNNPSRKTKYDLISVYKGETLINMDSQVPNKVFYEWLLKGNLFGEGAYIKPEFKYGNSRLDFYAENGGQKNLIEVKGVTLEKNGIAMFPDAPTQRGIKHIEELIGAVKNGYNAYIAFIIQMKGIKEFTPNYETHREFGEALKRASKAGIRIICLDCLVTENSIEADKEVKVKL